MDDRRKKAFDFAVDATKLLISLSTGIIAVSITFSKDVVQSTPPASRRLLFAGWICYLISIAFGVMCVMCMTGNLEPKSPPKHGQSLGEPTIWAPNITRTSAVQIFAFLGGTLLMIIHATFNL